jgi:hypothetical protein
MLNNGVLKATVGAVLAIGFFALPARGQAAPLQGPQPQGPQAPAPAYPDFNTVTKGMQPSPGLITLFQQSPQDPQRDSSKLLAQIPRGLLNQDLLLASTISRGENAGFNWDDYLIRFEMLDKKVIISIPDTQYVRNPNTTAAELVGRTHTSGFLAAMPIVTMSPQGDPVVDLGSVVLGSLGQLPPPYSPQTMGFGGIAGQRRDLSHITKVKSFPENIVVDVDLAFMKRDGSGENLGISYAIRRLPDVRAYQPRLADERVGYFPTVHQDWGAKHSERDNLVRYINRWDLKKKDPSLELSPPEKPIVFIIEKTVPLQWRKYVSEGITEWNKAFEKIGISNAIVAEQQSDDNEYGHVDPEDARYNFVRWVITGQAFAVAMPRVDPRTGQILNAEVAFDDSMLRSYSHEFDIFGPGPVATTLGPDVTKFLEQNPEYIPQGQTPAQVRQITEQMSGPFALDDSGRGRTNVPGDRKLAQFGGLGMCNYAAGMQRELDMANVLSGATGRKVPERLVGEVIRMIISHEVGHTLGLRHNFKASSWLPLDEIKRRRDSTDEPVTASVMDYNPNLYFPGDDVEKVHHFCTPTVGPYDYWAIEYGYRAPGPQDGGEPAMLAKIAGQCAQKEHAYATDEDTTIISPDPLTNRFDMSSDPQVWAKERMELCDSLLKDIRKWGERKQQPRHYFLSSYGMVMSEKARNMLYVSRVPGGEYFNRSRIGDEGAQPPIVLVDPRQQRAAIKMLSETIFSDTYFTSDPDLLNELVPSRDWGMEGLGGVSMRVDYPIHQMISNLQAYAMMNLCTPYVMQRVYDAELKSKSDDKFTAAELVHRVRDTIWSELGSVNSEQKYTDARPMISSIRRNLQRQHLAYMLASAGGSRFSPMSPDLQSMVRFSLRELGDEISEVLSKAKADGELKLDFATRAHLTECRDQIDKALDVQHVKRTDPS